MGCLKICYELKGWFGSRVAEFWGPEAAFGHRQLRAQHCGALAASSTNGFERGHCGSFLCRDNIWWRRVKISWGGGTSCPTWVLVLFILNKTCAKRFAENTHLNTLGVWKALGGKSLLQLCCKQKGCSCSNSMSPIHNACWPPRSTS